MVPKTNREKAAHSLGCSIMLLYTFPLYLWLFTLFGLATVTNWWSLFGILAAWEIVTSVIYTVWMVVTE
jgi:hypothetical protein